MKLRCASRRAQVPEGAAMPRQTNKNKRETIGRGKHMETKRKAGREVMNITHILVY